eukprot:Skav200418  [mRNA]  locus=scaffold260:13454:14056:+ [translate_table: standard]
MPCQFSDCFSPPISDEPIYNVLGENGNPFVVAADQGALMCGEEEQTGSDEFCQCLVDTMGSSFVSTSAGKQSLGGSVLDTDAEACFTRNFAEDFQCDSGGLPQHMLRNPHRTCQWKHELSWQEGISVRVPRYTRIVGMCYQADGTVQEPIDAECQLYDIPIPTQCEPNSMDFDLPLLGELKSFNFLVECCDPSLGVSRLH